MNPSRRAVLLTAGATAVLASAATAAAAPDAELLRLCAELAENERRQHEATVRYRADLRARGDDGAGITPHGRAFEAELGELLDEWDGIVEDIAATSAETPAGVRAKAWALDRAFRRDVFTCADLPPDEQGKLHERLAWSLARDLLADRG